MDTPFTCITCRMVFEDLTQQKSHYQTAWHCFNLKRKVAGLAPVTQDIFDEKVAALKGEKEGTQAPAKKQTNNSKKHFKQRREKTRRVMKVQNATLPPEIDLPEEEPAEEETETAEKTEEELVAERVKNARAIPATESLFDNHKSKDLESNLEYMRKNFGFFIPDIDYLTDLEGLITYLGQKIGIGYACLYCTKELGSVGAIQSHMVDKCHCKINFYGEEEEFADFYDWSSLLGEDNGEEKNTEDKDKQIIVSTEQHSKAIHLTENGGELVLPTQRTIGHRDFNLYYKQRHRPTDNRVSVLTNQLARQYRDLGIENAQSDVDYVSRRKKDLAWMKLGTNANKLPKYMRHNTSMC